MSKRARKVSPPAAEPAPSAAPRRDRRPWIFAALDVVFAALYIGVGAFVQSSDGLFLGVSLVLASAVLASAVGTAVRKRWGWWLAVAGSTVLLSGALVLVALLVASAAFMSGVYGALGDSIALACMVAGALIIEFYALLPAFQLHYLLSPDGRRALA
jgi:hypothetical protein